MAENKVQLTKADRWSVCLRSTFLQGSWNYERMQNGGWCYAMIPAIKRLYTTKEEQSAALKRHLEFFNTQPYVAAPILGVTLALEEDRANGAPVEDAAIQGVKVGMMGPLAGVGDPVFWFTARPILAALGASFALTGSILGPIIFFVFWNILRMAFLWYTQEFGYNVGTAITKNLSGGLLGKITKGASILGMFVHQLCKGRILCYRYSGTRPVHRLGSSSGWQRGYPSGSEPVRKRRFSGTDYYCSHNSAGQPEFPDSRPYASAADSALHALTEEEHFPYHDHPCAVRDRYRITPSFHRTAVIKG